MRKNEMDNMVSTLPASVTDACVVTPAPKSDNATAWPLKAEDGSPLAWWRMLPAETFGKAECLQLRATLEQINVLHGDADFAAALRGNATAAIDVAFTVAPIEEVSLTSDIAMTALLSCA